MNSGNHSRRRTYIVSEVMSVAVFIVLGTLAAFGLLSALWTLIGWALPGGRGGCIVCQCRPDGKELLFLGRVQILCKLGICAGDSGGRKRVRRNKTMDGT